MTKLAHTYSDQAGERYAFIRELLERAARPGCEVVELGAAPGEQSVSLARAGYRVTAVDLGVASDDWNEQPTGAMETAFAANGIRLVVWDLEEAPYPLPEQSADAVLLTEVLEHLRDYPARSLGEARRILRVGGCLILTTPNAAYVRKRWQLLRGRSIYTPLGDWLHGLPHARHAREYTREELETLVRSAGLEPVLVTSRHFYRQGGRRSLPARLGKATIDLLARVAPTLGPALVVVARRTEA